jgi:hypothetical protein
MSLEFDSDLDGYLDADFGHGISATYTPSGGSASTIKVILDDEYLSMIGLSVDVEGSQPIAYCKTSDVSSAAHGDTLAFAAQTTLSNTQFKAATTYNVVGVQPDGTGITALTLEQQ